MYSGQQNQFDVIDILSVLSFILGLQNLQENREQSAHNDVSAANDRQARYLIEEMSKQFKEQNELLYKIMRTQEELADKIDELERRIIGNG